MATTTAWAQDDKQALATKLAQLQAESEGPLLTEQLVGSAVEPVVVAWAQHLDQNLPAERREEVGGKLDAELEKLASDVHEAVDSRIKPAAQAAMAPIFMERLSADEMKIIIAYIESPASKKLAALGADATNAWAQGVMDITRDAVNASVESFDAAATRIVGSSPSDSKQ